MRRSFPGCFTLSYPYLEPAAICASGFRGQDRSGRRSIWNGKAVFRFAVDIVEKSIRQLLEQQQLDVDDVDVVLCHQANSRIIDYVQRKLAPKRCRFFEESRTFGKYLCRQHPRWRWMRCVRRDCSKAGMRIITVGFGAGLTWGRGHVRRGNEKEMQYMNCNELLGTEVSP